MTVDSPARGAVRLVKWLSDSLTGTEESRRKTKLLERLSESTMFHAMTNEQREQIAELCVPITFAKGEVLLRQDQAQDRALVIVEGECVRHRVDDDQEHIVGTFGYAQSSATVGMLHLLSRAPCFATLRAHSDGVAFQIRAVDLERLLTENPNLALSTVRSLCAEVVSQNGDDLARTPLFMSQSKSLPWFAITCAAAVESFYRSGMNALINSALTGSPRGALFPNMHIQVPIRILYINGFKGLRYFMDSSFPTIEDQATAAALATVPGIIMAPISSVLEATNAGHANPEPMARRWTRGFVPRGAREVIFGMGINQLSDYYEERMTLFRDPVVRNLGASLCAGLVAGYLSHVPHSMSALKLLQPTRKYPELFKSYSADWDRRVPRDFGRGRGFAVGALACLLPKGCLVRSAQIAGSFVIINSAILMLKHIKVDVYDASKQLGRYGGGGES